MSEYLLEMTNITKYIYDSHGKPIKGTDVKILSDVCFNLKPGEVHVLLGENGAGKSTLMRVLGGIIPPDGGRIVLEDKEVRFKDPRDSRANGIGFIHQELNLCTNLDVAHNTFLGREIVNPFRFMQKRDMYRKTRELLDSLGFDINPRALVANLSPAQQQVIEIAKAFTFNPKLLIMDEPTSSLTSQEIDKLFELIDSMRQKGIGIVYISHRMEEIMRVGDRVTVLRDGRYVGTMLKADFTVDKAVLMMAGRTSKQTFSERGRAASNEIALDVENVRIQPEKKPISIHVKSGEIVGLGGLVGAGRTELAQAIFGARSKNGGKVRLFGEEVALHHPEDSIAKGIGYLSEDRKLEGLTLQQTVADNIVSAALVRLFKRWFISRKQEDSLAEDMIGRFNVICRGKDQKVFTLSGGNQQRVSYAKWMAISPKILLLDEPTRGIDVNAKAEIYKIMGKAAAEGMAILMISSEMPELLGMSDRIYIMRDLELVKELKEPEEMNAETVLQYTIGGKR